MNKPMARLTDTRDQIMDRAAELLMQRGFNGFSYRDISSHLGVKNAAVHYHFPNKTDLALALIDEYRQMLQNRTSKFMANGGSARQQLEGLFGFTEYQCNEGRCICPLGAFSVDFDELPDDVREATAGFMSESIKWLTRVLEVGREQEEFDFEGDAGKKALHILAVLQGARQMARISNFDVLSDVIAEVRAGVGIKA